MRILSPLPCPLLFHCFSIAQCIVARSTQCTTHTTSATVHVGYPLAGHWPTVADSAGVVDWLRLPAAQTPVCEISDPGQQTSAKTTPLWRYFGGCGPFFANIDFRSSHRAPSNCMRPRHWLETIVNGSFFFLVVVAIGSSDCVPARGFYPAPHHAAAEAAPYITAQ